MSELRYLNRELCGDDTIQRDGEGDEGVGVVEERSGEQHAARGPRIAPSTRMLQHQCLQRSGSGCEETEGRHDGVG